MRIRPVFLLAALALLPSSSSGAETIGFENWVFWFHSNREWLDPPRKVDDAVDARVEPDILPVLRWACSRKHGGHQAIQGASYIALGKLARSNEHVTWIRAGLTAKAGDLQALEGAALGLGLLRRSDPARQLTAAILDAVRSHLFSVAEDPAYPSRTRGFCAVSLGLLGDQPTGAGNDRKTTARLMRVLEVDHPARDLFLAASLGLGLQAPKTFTPDQLQILRDGILGNRLPGLGASDLTRSYLIQTLGRVGAAADHVLLNGLLTNRRRTINERRSAATALGVLGRRVDETTRAAIHANLVGAMGSRRLKDRSARGLAMISIGQLLVRLVEDGAVAQALKSDACKFLIKTATRGPGSEPVYAVLGLALVARAVVGSEAPEAVVLRRRVADVLRTQLTSKRLNARTRSGFAVAAGLAQDVASIPHLMAVVADRRHDEVLSGYAALGLGYAEDPRETTWRAVARAHARAVGEETRITTLDAMALLRAPGTRDAALHALKTERGQPLKAQAAIVLGRLEDAGVIDDLNGIVRDKRQQDLTRMIAVAALGRVADPEERPSLGLVTGNLNYRAMSELLNEIAGKL